MKFLKTVVPLALTMFFSSTLSQHCAQMNTVKILTGDRVYFHKPDGTQENCTVGYQGLRDYEMDSKGNMYMVDEITSQIIRVPGGCGKGEIITSYEQDTFVAGPRSVTLSEYPDGSLILYVAMIHADAVASQNKFPKLAQYRQVYSFKIEADGTWNGVYGIVGTTGGRIPEAITNVEWNADTNTLWGIERNKFVVRWDGAEWDRLPEIPQITDMRKVDTRSFEKCGWYLITADDNNQVFRCTDLEDPKSCVASCGWDEIANPWAIAIDDSCNYYSASTGDTNIVMYNSDRCSIPEAFSDAGAAIYAMGVFVEDGTDPSVCEGNEKLTCDEPCTIPAEKEPEMETVLLPGAPGVGLPPPPGGALEPPGGGGGAIDNLLPPVGDASAAATSTTTVTKTTELYQPGADRDQVIGSGVVSVKGNETVIDATETVETEIIPAATQTRPPASRPVEYYYPRFDALEVVYFISDAGLYEVDNRGIMRNCTAEFRNARDLSVDPTTGDVFVADMIGNKIYRVVNCNETFVVAEFNADDDTSFFINNPYTISYDYLNEYLYVGMRKSQYLADQESIINYKDERNVYRLQLENGVWNGDIKPMVRDDQLEFPWITQVRWSDDNRVWGVENFKRIVEWNDITNTWVPLNTTRAVNGGTVRGLSVGSQICGSGLFTIDDSVEETYYCKEENCTKLCLDDDAPVNQLWSASSSTLTCRFYVVDKPNSGQNQGIVIYGPDGRTTGKSFFTYADRIYAIQPYTLLSKSFDYQPADFSPTCNNYDEQIVVEP